MEIAFKTHSLSIGAYGSEDTVSRPKGENARGEYPRYSAQRGNMCDSQVQLYFIGHQHVTTVGQLPALIVMALLHSNLLSLNDHWH